MASGKQSPRQKMINMMYLVLTAMLALNVSKDILEALTKLDQSLEATVSTVEDKNQDIYSLLNKAASQDLVKAGEWRDKALEVKSMSDDLNKYIEDMKKELIEISGGPIEGNPNVPKKLDSREKPANYLLNDGNGAKLKSRIEKFRDDLIIYADGDQAIIDNINTMFDTSPQKEGDKKVPWENSKFEHFPLGAILPFLTDLQAKVRNSESDVISILFSNINRDDVKFNQVEAAILPTSSYVTEGGQYEAEVFLAAYDNTQKPTITITKDGQQYQLPVEQVQNGRGKVVFDATSVGEQTWGGVISIKQIGSDEPKTYKIPETKYTVAPRSVVISPTAMNVLYRGVDNPLEIGVPGVDPARVNASGPGVRKSGNGTYVANVQNVRGKEITINVTVQEEDKDGNVSQREAGSKKFRIKGLPPAVATVYGKENSMRSKNAIKKAPIKAEFKDFPFNLPLTVYEFEVAIPGYPPEKVKGSKMPSTLAAKIEKVRPGQTITIRNIKARSAQGAKVKASSVTIDVN